MKQQGEEGGKASVPLYAKVGWGVAWLVMLGLTAMILRNCATSVFYGLQTDAPRVEQVYQEGMSDGRLGHGQAQRGQEENSVLRKAYIKGYRTGVDQGRSPSAVRP